MLDIEKLIAGVHDYIGRVLAPFALRVKALEDRAPERGEKGDRGEKGEPGDSIRGERGEKGDVGPAGERGEGGAQGQAGINGKDAIVDYDRIGTAIKEVVAVAVDEIPKPKDGKDGASIHPDTVARMVREAVDAMPRTLAADGKDGKDGRDGKDADPAVISAMIAEGVAQALPGAVQRAIDALMPSIIAKAAEAVPRPRDGAPGRDGRDAPELDAVVEAVVKRLPEVKDGRDGRDAPPIDMDAVVAKAVALIPVPKDGADGSSVTLDDLRPIFEAETARWQLEFERRATDTMQRAIDNAPKPADGKDGQDAAQLETFDAVLDGRMLKLSLTAGERVISKDMRLPIPIDKGVFRSGVKYEQGDVVTYGGSQWIALKDTATRPPSDDWRCCVQKGKDGKDAPA